MPDPLIQTTVVGSYPVPAWLAAMPSLPALRDAMLVVLKTQELAGLDVVTDGELGRFDVNNPDSNGMIETFVAPLAGVSGEVTRAEIEAFRAQPGLSFRPRPAGVVRGPVSAGTLDLLSPWERARTLTDRPLKFTVTSPYMLARTLHDTHYGDLPALAMDIAAVLAEQVADIDCAVLQIDEANLTGNPADAVWAHQPINRVLDAFQGEKGLHLCFGNFGGSTVQQGYWQDLVPFFNRLHTNHLLLEVTRRDPAELEVLSDLRDDIALGTGVIDIKDNETESADLVASRIEAAVRMLGAERIRWVHPDCGFWMLPRSVADRKMAALVQGRDLFLGRAG